MLLSLCIATYNEGSNIHYPLDSVYDLVDEVVIVDGGSTDKTVEVAQAYGKKVRVYREKFERMFHINKQKAIERARGEWILQLDADEELSHELKKEIESIVIARIRQLAEAKQSQKEIAALPSVARNDDIVAFWVPRKNFFLTRFLTKGGQYPDYTIRLYKNGVARFPCKNVHENVEIISPVISNEVRDLNKISRSARNDKNAIGYLKNPILHHADPDFSRYLIRWDRYTTLEAEVLTKTMKQWNNETIKKSLMFFDYFILKPAATFFSMYFRHLGFLDGFPGFVFALFSSIRFWAIYIKLLTARRLTK